MTTELDPNILTQAESAALDAIANGRVAAFEGAPPVLRAAVLAERVEAAPRGLRVSGARIEGRLDLTDASLTALVLEDCELPDVIDLTGAQLGRLSIHGSRFSHLLARDARIGAGLDFRATSPIDALAWIDAGRATIRGGVDGSGARLNSPEPRPRDLVLPWEHNYALRLSETEIQGNVVLNGLIEGSRFVADGGVCLDDAHIKGSLWMRVADVYAKEGDAFHPGDAIHAHAAVIDGFVGLNFGFTAKGRVWFQGAKIRERLSIGLEYDNRLRKVDEMWDWGNRQMNQSVLLHLDQVEIGGSVIINAIDIDGAIGMAHCKLGAGVTIGGTIRGRSADGAGMAINARGSHIHGDFNLSRSLEAEGRINLAESVITGSINFGNAVIDNSTEDGRGVAVDLSWAEVGRSVMPPQIATGALPDGSSIKGRVVIENARFGARG
jgi:hypothetical protein